MKPEQFVRAFLLLLSVMAKAIEMFADVYRKVFSFSTRLF